MALRPPTNRARTAAPLQSDEMNGLGSVGSVIGRGSAVIFFIGLVTSAVISPLLSARLEANRRLIFVSLIAISLIIAVTWPLGTRHAVRHLGDTFDPGAMMTWWRESWGTRTYKLLAKQDSRNNIALFVPAGFLWTVVMIKRAAPHAARRVIAALLGLSFLVESVQAVSGVRDADTRDLVTNTVGAAIGALTALLAGALRRRPPANGIA